MKKAIAHLDINSFFATIEQQANPYLRNRPLAVIKGFGRTCIIAASSEAKKFRVKTGCRTWEAKKLCPRILFVPADFDKYFPVTQELIRICSQNAPVVEVFSLDEVFLDLTGLSNPISIIQKIQKQVALEIGDQITLSAGLSHNRLLAKLGSDLAAKNQILIINHQNQDQFLAKIKPSTICGIGPRIEARLFNLGITNLLQIRKIPEKFLKAGFGPFCSQRLKEISFGLDSSTVTPLTQLPQPKTVSRTFTLFANTFDQKIISATLRNLGEEVAAKLRKLQLVGKTIGLSIRGGDFLGFHQTSSLADFTDDGQRIFKKVWQIFENHHWSLSTRFLGVWVTSLKEKRLLTPSLFPEVAKREKILHAVDQVNHRFGSLTVFPGVLLGQKLIRPEVTGFLGDKTLRFNSLSH